MNSDNDISTLQGLRRQLFAMRNGVVADALRKGGCAQRIIFGVNLPQLQEIATSHGYDRDSARVLWRSTNSRESMLLAIMLVNPYEFGRAEAKEWIKESPSCEILDVLVLKLLSRMPSKTELLNDIAGADGLNCRYAAMRLAWRLIGSNNSLAEKVARAELGRGDAITASLAKSILDELDYLDEPHV